MTQKERKLAWYHANKDLEKQRIRARERYALDPSLRLASNRRSYLKNREKRLAADKLRRDQNIDRARVKDRDYDHANANSRRATEKRRYALKRVAIRARQNAYRHANLDIVR